MDKNYFTDRSRLIDFNEQLLDKITLKRGAHPGSVLGAFVYISAHHDLHLVFQVPKNNHLYVDDLECVCIPNIYSIYKEQLIEVEKRINNDSINSHKYATKWHQSVNRKKKNS